MTTAFRAPVAAMGLLRNALVGLGAAFSARQVIQYAEAYTIVQNQLRVAGVESHELAAATEEVFDIATRTRTPVEQIAELYSRTSVAAKELGISQREALQFTELVGQAIAVAGASSAAASGALTQLSQALGGTVIQAQEFNSIIDGARPLIVAAANGLEEAGGSVARFRQLVLEGRVTAQEFFQAVQRGADSITEPFERAVIRPSQALQNLRTAMIETVGEMDQAGGASAALASAINDLAEAISSDAFQEGAIVLARDIASGLRDSVVLAQELNNWTYALTGNMTSLGEVIRLPAQQFKFMVDQIARLAGATAAPVTTLEELAPPEIVQRIQQAQQSGGPLEVDVRRGARTPGAVETSKATFQDIIAPVESRLALLRQTELSEDRISEILAAQSRLKRDLTNAEREALIEINAAVDLEERRRELAEASVPRPPPSREDVLGPEATEVISRTRTEAELFAAAQQRLNELLQAGAIDQDTYNRAIVQTQAELSNTAQEFEIAMRAAEIFASTASSGIVEAITAGDSLGETFSNITTSIAQAVAEMLIFQAIMAAIGGPAGTGGPATGLFGIFGGGRQHGGPVRRGEAYIVGEAGKELFIPDTSGHVVSNPDTTAMLAGGGGRGTPWAGEAGAPHVTVQQRVTINNSSDAKVATSQDDRGDLRIDILDEAMANNLRPGTATSRAMRDRFGLQFQTRR